MKIGVNTNESALLALQHLNSTNEDLVSVQNRVSTGRRVNDAKDNASVWSIAQKQRGALGALGAVRMGLDRAASIAQVSMTAGTSISDFLIQMKEKIVAAKDTSIDATSRSLLNDDFRALVAQIKLTVNNAGFDGANIFDGSITGGINFLANAGATMTITLSAQNLSFGGSIITIGATDSITTATLATSVLAKLQVSIDNMNKAMGALGSQFKQIETHNTFLSKLSDSLETGIGNLVDADLAKESARLQALNIKQELGTQSLAISNRQPQMILNLFK